MIAEVAPLASPQFDALLISALVVFGCLVALGLVSILHRVSTAVVGGMAGLLGKIPGLGKVLSTPVNIVVNWMDREFTKAEHALDAALANYLHQLGQLVRWFGAEIRDLAHSVYTLATVVIPHAVIDALKVDLAAVRGLVSGAVALATDAWHVATWARWQITHVAEGVIGAAVIALITPLRDSVQAALNHVAGRILALEATVGGVIATDIGNLWEWTKRLGDLYNSAAARIAALERAVSTEALTAAVALAITKLGLDWIRCNRVGRFGRAMCGGSGAFFDDLLALVAEAFILTNVCTLIPLLEEAASAVAVPLVEGLTVVGAGLCAGSQAAPALPTPPGFEIPKDYGIHLFTAAA